ncbi:MAG: hypothetical protein EOO68_00290 [Moraxellaceae bacterium]|nr:MAG: hypothetical protein EOO68_00290 [Moraxellaceae bacterium]
MWPENDASNASILCPYIGIFFMGCGVASLHYHAKTSLFMNKKNTCIFIDGLAMLAVLGLIYLIPSVTGFITGKNIPLDYYHKKHLLFGALWSLILFACLNGFGMFRWFFELSALRYLGFISFSLYFFHTTSVALIKYFLPQLPFAAWWMLLIAVGISHLTWFLIEKPTARVRLKYSS